MPCSSQITGEMLPEIHTMKQVDFPKLIIHSQIERIACTGNQDQITHFRSGNNQCVCVFQFS